MIYVRVSTKEKTENLSLFAGSGVELLARFGSRQGSNISRPQVVDCARVNDLELVSRIFASWNQIHGWLRRLEGLRCAA